jgi:hypothetical protein
MKRWRLAVASFAGLVLVAVAVAYLTGLISIGDPFLGTWKPAGGGMGVHVLSSVVHGMDPSDEVETDTLVFHPWNRHLVLDMATSKGHLKVEFVKVSGSTSTTPAPSELQRRRVGDRGANVSVRSG